MNWTVYTEALYAYFQLIHCIYIFLFRYFTSLHRGVSQQWAVPLTELLAGSPAPQWAVPLTELLAGSPTLQWAVPLTELLTELLTGSPTPQWACSPTPDPQWTNHRDRAIKIINYILKGT